MINYVVIDEDQMNEIKRSFNKKLMFNTPETETRN